MDVPGNAAAVAATRNVAQDVQANAMPTKTVAVPTVGPNVALTNRTCAGLLAVPVEQLVARVMHAVEQPALVVVVVVVIVLAHMLLLAPVHAVVAVVALDADHAAAVAWASSSLLSRRLLLLCRGLPSHRPTLRPCQTISYTVSRSMGSVFR